MARFIPKIDPSSIQNPGERKIAQLLTEQLSDQTTVIHSFNWVQRRKRSGVLIEGETDFIVLDSEFGVLFVEVKGGILRYVSESNQWQRRVGNEQWLDLNKDPFAQVRASTHRIASLLKEHLQLDSLPLAYAYAVAIPDGVFFGDVPVSFDRDLIFDIHALKNVKSAISRAFRRFARNQDQPQLTKTLLRRIERILFPEYSIVPALHRTVENQEYELHRLTEDQQQILSILKEQKFAAIRGGAGTGKTLIAVEKARQMANSGHRTLFLCFTRLLSDWLNQSLDDEFGDTLTIANYHQFVHSCCESFGIPFTDEEIEAAEEDFWKHKTPDKLIEAGDRMSAEQKYSAVIVDEGQDFTDLWWLSLESIFADPANKECFYIFYDSHQNLFHENLCLPDEFEYSYQLTTNCRNTVNIGSHCSSLIDVPHQSSPNAPEGEIPVIEGVATLREAIQLIGNCVRSLCNSRKGGLSTSQIAVLAPAFTLKQWPEKIKRISLTSDLNDWFEGKGVLLSSYHRFKGLEADVAIIVSRPLSENDDQGKVENYVARSRAKHKLIVFEVEELSRNKN